MKSTAGSPQEYIAQAPEERQATLEALRRTVQAHLPAGFEESMQYGMIGYVVPHSIYPPGYHANPKDPLPFIGLASQKNHLVVYHMGLYLFPAIQHWFIGEYPNHMATKLDMGKGCIRFKSWSNLPYGLIAQLCEKITVEEYIAAYEASKPENTRPRLKT